MSRCCYLIGEGRFCWLLIGYLLSQSSWAEGRIKNEGQYGAHCKVESDCQLGFSCSQLGFTCGCPVGFIHDKGVCRKSCKELANLITEKDESKSKKKEEPGSFFQRQRVDLLLGELAKKFPPKFVAPTQPEAKVEEHVKVEVKQEKTDGDKQAHRAIRPPLDKKPVKLIR